MIFCTICDVICYWKRSNYFFGDFFRCHLNNLCFFLIKAKLLVSPMLTAFSALSNGKHLFSCKSKSTSPRVFSCFYGIRAIGTFWIIFGHLDFYLTNVNLSYIEHEKVISYLDLLKLPRIIHKKTFGFFSSRHGLDTLKVEQR